MPSAFARSRHFLAVLGVSLCALLPVRAADETQAALELAVARVHPSLVRIHVVAAEWYDGRESKHEAYGSGAIISPDGLVITNHHVAANARAITCTLTDREEMDAELVGSDALTDIAVLKLKPAQPRTFPAVQFGNSDAVQVGEVVFAMGCPLAFAQSVTRGVVSNTALMMPEAVPDDWLLLDGEDVTSVVRWIAHDAAIFPGNSGGPLVNAKGEIVGINEVSFGLSGAIPGNLARTVATTLAAQGKVTRSWTGLSVQPPLKSSTTRGVLVAGTLAGSPAANAGFQRGDVLVKIGERAVDVRSREDLPAFNDHLMTLPIGTPVAMVVRRADTDVTLTLTPAVRPEAQAMPQEFKAWGLCASALSVIQAEELQRAGAAGVYVESVRVGSPANNAKPPLAAGDVIVEMAGTPVPTPEAFRLLTQKLLLDKRHVLTPVLVAFERRGERLLTVVKLGTLEGPDSGREVRKSWLPISSQVVTHELAEALGLHDVTGVRITQVYPKSAAEAAGLRVGDIITAVDDDQLETTQPEHSEMLATLIRQYPVGSTAVLTVLRMQGADAVELTKLPVTLPAAPKLPREMPRYRDEQYEFSVRDLAFSDRLRAGMSETQPGVLVDSVGDGGWAALGQLHAGDIIETLDGQPMSDVAAVRASMTRLAVQRPKLLRVEVKRGIRTIFLELAASWPVD